MVRSKYNPEEYIGKKINSWTIIGISDQKIHNKVIVDCRCECGRISKIPLTRIVNGYTRQCKSCAHITHGKCNTRLYTIWRGMLDRCYNQNVRIYKYYGGRGISVDKQWSNFEPFYEWAINNGYRNDLTIDRIDTNGNYEPDNCKWSTHEEQAVNRRMLKNNTSGYNGIVKNFRRNRWCAQIEYERKHFYLGSYTTQKEALAVLNSFIIVNKLPHKIQEYKGELATID